MKLFVIVLFGLAFYWLLRQIRRKRPMRDDTSGKDSCGTDRMVACARCGIYVPTGESLTKDGRQYCSESHRELGTRTDPS